MKDQQTYKIVLVIIGSVILLGLGLVWLASIAELPDPEELAPDLPVDSNINNNYYGS